MEKNWLCWEVGPALFSKVTLFSLCQKRSVGLKYAKIWTPSMGELKFCEYT